MKLTIAHLASLLAAAVERGHGEMEVNVHLNTSAPLFPESEPVAIKNFPVERNATGRWRHPCFPAEWTLPMSTWLRERGFDFTVTYLLKPDNYSPDDITNCKLVPPIHKGRSGAWFCWEINTNTDGEPISVWIAPTE